MTRIAILGAAGYTALELIKILLRHPEAEIVAVTDRQEGQPHVAMIHPSLTGRLDLRLEDLSPAEVAARAECVFSCLPHGVSAALIPAPAGRRHAGGRFQRRLPARRRRGLRSSGTARSTPTRPRLGKVVYGLPELFREQIPRRPAGGQPGLLSHVGHPAAGPAAEGGADRAARTIIVDSKSGVSGAGRTPKLTTHYPECNESISAYNVGRHRHTPEIDQILSTAAGAAGRGHLHAPPGADGPRHPHHRPTRRPTADVTEEKRARRRSASSTPTSRSCAWSTTCRARRTRWARTSATSRPASSAAAC